MLTAQNTGSERSSGGSKGRGGSAHDRAVPQLGPCGLQL